MIYRTKDVGSIGSPSLAGPPWISHVPSLRLLFLLPETEGCVGGPATSLPALKSDSLSVRRWMEGHVRTVDYYLAIKAQTPGIKATMGINLGNIVLRASQTRPAGFHLQEMSRSGTSMGTEGRFVVARSWGGREAWRAGG